MTHIPVARLLSGQADAACSLAAPTSQIYFNYVVPPSLIQSLPRSCPRYQPKTTQATSHQPPAMAAKRDSSCIANSDRDEEPAYQPSTKRARNAGSGQRSKQQQHEPMTNTTYGQRCCFPGIEEDKVAYSDEDLEFEDESDALAYLKSVR